MKKGNLILLSVFSMVLISFLCLLISQSYSYVLGTSASNNNQIISSGNIDSTITPTVMDGDISALSDEDGIAQETYGQIDVSKNNQYSIYYNINLSYSLSDLQSGETVQDFLPAEYIKVALFEISDGVISSEPLIGPVLMADLPLFSVDTSNVFNDKYFLTFGTFDAGSDFASYALKVWADENTPLEYDSSLLYLSLNVYQEPLVSKQTYNLKGKVYNGSTPVSGATVSLQNGTIIATSSSDGSYTLNEVPEGTYNLKITSGDNVKETNIHVSGSSSISVTETSPIDGISGSFIQNNSYTYYTTPYKIMSSNSLTTNTSVASTSSYTIPKSYVITGTQAINTIDINNLKININSTSLISIGS